MTNDRIWRIDAESYLTNGKTVTAFLRPDLKNCVSDENYLFAHQWSNVNQNKSDKSELRKVCFEVSWLILTSKKEKQPTNSVSGCSWWRWASISSIFEGFYEVSVFDRISFSQQKFSRTELWIRSQIFILGPREVLSSKTTEANRSRQLFWTVMTARCFLFMFRWIKIRAEAF